MDFVARKDATLDDFRRVWEKTSKRFDLLSRYLNKAPDNV
jgi:hypothetical protein